MQIHFPGSKVAQYDHLDNVQTIAMPVKQILSQVRSSISYAKVDC